MRMRKSEITIAKINHIGTATTSPPRYAAVVRESRLAVYPGQGGRRLVAELSSSSGSIAEAALPSPSASEDSMAHPAAWWNPNHPISSGEPTSGIDRD
jgi:hypothetical protein